MTTGERAQPTISDPNEQAIRELLNKEFSTDFSKKEIARLKTEQIDFIAQSIRTLSNKETGLGIYQNYLLLLASLGSTTKIKFGERIIESLPDSGFIVATNHLAMPKATRFSRHDLGEKIGDHQLLLQLPEEIEPFPVRHAAVATTLGSKFIPHEVAIELPYPYKHVQSKSGVVMLPSAIGGRFAIMGNRVKELFMNGEKQYVITYPESGTTGKRGGGGLYGIAQEDFHTGFLRLAFTLQQQLDRQVPIVVVGQVFHPERGFVTGILDPITVKISSDETELGHTASSIQLQLSELIHQLRFDK